MSTGAVWLVVVLTALTTVVTKGIGPVATVHESCPTGRFGWSSCSPRRCSPRSSSPTRWPTATAYVGADTAGALVAALLLRRRANVLVVVVAAAAVTAGLRAVGIG